MSSERERPLIIINVLSRNNIERFKINKPRSIEDYARSSITGKLRANFFPNNSLSFPYLNPLIRSLFHSLSRSLFRCPVFPSGVHLGG